jgi:hypothetical protein
MQMMNRIQRQWTWTITGQYLRALAGMRFPRCGASECDVMFNLVPEVASADSQVFWSNGCFTNMLDYGGEHLTLRQLDMPRNFFSGNNSVAEYGNFPSNFLLGVSTPASDIQFRRQMWSRPGEPLTVAGNPPIRFASTFSEAESKTYGLPDFRLFLTRVFLFDFCGIGVLPIAEVLIFTIIYICLLRFGGHSAVSAVIALALTEVNLVLLCIAVKKALVGRKWGTDDATPFWSWRHFAYFFAQDCFFAWCRAPLGFCAGTVLSNFILRRMGCRVGDRTIVTRPMQCSDWNAVSFGEDCVVDGFLQFHSFENMLLKAKRADIGDGCVVNFGATVMGGATIERNTTLLPLSLVLKEMKLRSATYEGSPAEPVIGTSWHAAMHDAAPSKRAPRPVDNTDWLKAAAIILVLVDHFGHFFMDDDRWWSVLGRLAAPTFFFLLGYAQTRTVPLRWIWLGIALTLLNSWNGGWTWVAPNILLSLALIRIARPFVQILLEHYRWAAFVLLLCALVSALPIAGKIVDYGAEGWLWALFGLCQRMYVDRGSATRVDGTAQGLLGAQATTENLMRLLASFTAGFIYIWQEQREYSFPQIHFAVLILGVGVLSLALFLFRRGPSRVQPPEALAGLLRFIGRRTLEIYAIELAAFELTVKLIPDLAP